MRFALMFSLALSLTLLDFTTAAQEPIADFGTDFQAKRDALPSFHEEFQVNETVNFGTEIQDDEHRIAIDAAQNKWREFSASSFGDRLRIFDGQNLFQTEVDAQDYVHVKLTSKDKPEPSVYEAMEIDWTKAKELQRQPCGLPKIEHTCVLIEAPARNYAHLTHNGIVRVTGGVGRFLIDLETVLLIQSHSIETVEASIPAQMSSAAIIPSRPPSR